MTKSEKLSKEEFRDMLKAIKQHAETDMDQWALWSLNTKYGKAYISISVAPLENEYMYNDLSSLIEEE